MIGWTLCGRVDWKSSARNVTHPSTIPAVDDLTSEFPLNPGKGLGFKPPKGSVHQSIKESWAHPKSLRNRTDLLEYAHLTHYVQVYMQLEELQMVNETTHHLKEIRRGLKRK